MDIFSFILKEDRLRSAYYLFCLSCYNLWISLGKKKMRLGVACSGGSDSLLSLYFILLYQKENPSHIDYLIIFHIIDGQERVDTYLKESINQALQIVLTVAAEESLIIEVIENTDISVFLPNASFEGICHQIRKKIFIEKMKIHNLDRIVTGHNKTDQIEHFLIGVIRRSSIKRISGMKRDSGKYFRPLLFLEKKEIILMMNSLGKSYFDDPCNASEMSLRNKIRKNILPLFTEIDGRSQDSIIHFMDELNHYEEYIDEIVEEIMKTKLYYSIDYFLSLKTILQNKIIEKELYLQKLGSISSKKVISEIYRFLITKTQKSIHTVGCILVLKKKSYWNILAVD